MTDATSQTAARGADLDAVIVGAGFSGLYMLHKLRGLGLTARILEAAEGVGGTWYWNRYPGARVDVESQQYCYSFNEDLANDWHWTERYASQPELLRYLNHVADRFDLRRDIQFGTTVVSATFDESANLWTLRTDKGDTLRARFCVMATGCLSLPKEPDVPGAERFQGESHHTGRWPHAGVDFTGRVVGVIGTGSSAIQSIPQIARQADHVYVFQRTPNFSVPAHNGPSDPAVVQDWKENRARYRQQVRESGFGILITENERTALDATPEERSSVYEDCWARGGFSLLGAFADLIENKAANDTAAEFVRDKIRGIVKDPVVAEKLAPKSYPIATKRVCVDIGYFETFNRPNVTLVDLKDEPIETLTEHGLKTSKGEYKLDAIVYAIGFDAMTGALSKIDIRGRGNAALTDRWAHGPRTYLGLMIAGFPNLFLVSGPGSPSVLTNMAVSIEQHVEWISECIGWMRDRQMGAIEASNEAQDAWVEHVNEVADGTLFPLANSWYIGANVPGKPRVFMPYIGGFGVYRQTCEDVAAKGYEGFHLTEGA